MGPERLSDLPKVTQPANSSLEATQSDQFAGPALFHFAPRPSPPPPPRSSAPPSPPSRVAAEPRGGSGSGSRRAPGRLPQLGSAAPRRARCLRGPLRAGRRRGREVYRRPAADKGGAAEPERTPRTMHSGRGRPAAALGIRP